MKTLIRHVFLMVSIFIGLVSWADEFSVTARQLNQEDGTIYVEASVSPEGDYSYIWVLEDNHGNDLTTILINANTPNSSFTIPRMAVRPPDVSINAPPPGESTEDLPNASEVYYIATVTVTNTSGAVASANVRIDSESGGVESSRAIVSFEDQAPQVGINVYGPSAGGCSLAVPANFKNQSVLPWIILAVTSTFFIALAFMLLLKPALKEGRKNEQAHRNLNRRGRLSRS